MARGYLAPFRRGSIGAVGDRTPSIFGGSLFDLHRQVNRLFDDLLEEHPNARSSGFSAPALEVHQSDDKLEITAELPGVKQDDIELTVEDGVLTLRGEKRSTRNDEERGYSERTYGRFERSITLPANVDEEKCSAQFTDGVLTITMPKAAERQRGRRIPLGTGGPSNPRLEAQNDAEQAPRQEAAQEPSEQEGQDRQQA